MKRRQFVLRIIIHVLFPLFVGAGVYFLMKPSYFWIGRISLSYLHQEALVEKINNITQRLPLFLVAFTRNNLADFCWAYSMTSALLIFNETSLEKIPVKRLLIILLGASVGGEIVQVWLDDYFTFDFWDIGATLAGVCMSCFFLINKAT